MIHVDRRRLYNFLKCCRHKLPNWFQWILQMYEFQKKKKKLTLILIIIWIAGSWCPLTRDKSQRIDVSEGIVFDLYYLTNENGPWTDVLFCNRLHIPTIWWPTAEPKFCWSYQLVQFHIKLIKYCRHHVILNKETDQMVQFRNYREENREILRLLFFFLSSPIVVQQSELDLNEHVYTRISSILVPAFNM